MQNSRALFKLYFLLKKAVLVPLLSTLVYSSIYGNDCPNLLQQPYESTRLEKMRAKTLRGWDRMLTWTLSNKNRSFILATPLDQKDFHLEAKNILEFSRVFGYFSEFHPIVGSVTKDPKDFDIAQCLLREIHYEIPDLEQRLFATHEALTKIVAYRNLKKGTEITFSTLDSNGMNQFATFVVDEVIDLWHGMPAFGIIPKDKSIGHAVLLFRGTDLSLTTEKGWASVLSDLDLSGPGHSTFIRGRQQLEKWLEKVQTQGDPAYVMGMSLGGVLTTYSVVYLSHLLHPTFPSISFNAPGVSKEVIKDWEGKLEKPSYISYIAEGDFVSKIGFLLGDVWQMSIEVLMNVIESHATFISSQKQYSLSKVASEMENATH